MSEKNDYYTPPEASLMTVDPEYNRLPENESKEINGWFVLPVLWLVVTVLIAVWNIPEVLNYYKSVIWNFHIDTNPLWMVMVIMIVLNISYSIFLIFSPLYLLYLIIKKSKHLPKLMVYWALVMLLVQLVFAVLENILTSRFSAMNYLEICEEFFIPVLFQFIWMAYFHYSIRVKNTFIY